MEREGHPKTRHIVLGRRPNGLYVWTCSDCKWEHPFYGVNNTPDTHIEAIHDFSRHACLSHDAAESKKKKQ
jgi:hypothetical protein